jgi:ABC-type multidrug transport system permease subunit
MPKFSNPADFLIDLLLASDEERARMEAPNRVVEKDFVQAFQKSEMNTQLLANIDSVPGSYKALDSSEVRRYATSLWKQFCVLLQRTVRDTLRTPLASVVVLAQALIMAFIIGSIFYQLGYSQEAIFGRYGVLFFIMIFSSFGILNSTITFIKSRLLINRERAAGLYSVLPYFLAKSLCDIPMHILQGVLFATIMYWMAGLNPLATRFFTYLGILILNVVTAGSMYTLIGTLSPNETVGTIFTPLVTVLFFLFAGFFISNIPDWWIWMEYWSWFKYVFGALMVNEFAGATFICPSNTTSNATLAENATAVASNLTQPCISTGEDVLILFGVADVSVVNWCMVLLGMIIAYRILAFFVLAYLHKEKR